MRKKKIPSKVARVQKSTWSLMEQTRKKGESDAELINRHVSSSLKIKNKGGVLIHVY